MSKYNRYMNNHFNGCKLLANAYDNCRNRPVSLYELPGNLEHVGVSDGTDCWIAPVIAEPFSVNCRKLLDKMHEVQVPETSHPIVKKRHTFGQSQTSSSVVAVATVLTTQRPRRSFSI